MPTLTINNWQGKLTRYSNGDINSGLAKYTTTFGTDPFTNPGNLSWLEEPTQINTLTEAAGLIAQYKLEENTSNTNVTDSSGNQATATASQNTSVLSIIGKIDNAFDFNGTTDFVNIPHNANQLLTSGFTITCWVKSDSAGEAGASGIIGARILDKSDGSAAENGYTLVLNSSNAGVRFSVNNGGTISRSVGFVAGEWNHVALTVLANATVTFYINGAKSGNSASTGALAGITSTADIRIGNISGGTSRSFDGIIDDVRIYNQVLNTDEILRIYNSGTGTQSNVIQDVLTDLIMAARPRLESGVTYVYAIGHTGRLYKIQVNDPVTYNPNYDNAVLLATLTSNSPTFKYGPSIQFYGATERIYIGHDKGVTRIDFDGSNETFVTGTWTTNVPRPSVNFGGVTYWGNGTNLAAIDSSATQTTGARLSPAFPVGTQVRDIDVSPDGTYVQVVVSRIAQPDMTVTTQDTSNLSSSDSYFIYWNGIDAGYTAYNPFNSYSINSNLSFGQHGYTMGYDLGGAAIYTGGDKIISLPNSVSPNFNALFSTGNLMGFSAPENSDGFLRGTLILYGAYDNEIPSGLYRFFRISASGIQTDIIQMPVCAIVTNLFYGASTSGYTNNQVGTAKLYFSSLESSAEEDPIYKLYKFTTVPTGLGTAIQGVYETQNQLFSKKVKVGELRFYTLPLVTGNSFQVDLIGSDGGVIPGSSQMFTVGTNVTSGQDYCWYNPSIQPTYTIGLRITNLGSVNFTLTKAEIDHYDGGK